MRNILKGQHFKMFALGNVYMVIPTSCLFIMAVETQYAQLDIAMLYIKGGLPVN
jgi:hypothetical protein